MPQRHAGRLRWWYAWCGGGEGDQGGIPYHNSGRLSDDRLSERPLWRKLDETRPHHTLRIL